MHEINTWAVENKYTIHKIYVIYSSDATKSNRWDILAVVYENNLK